MNFSFEINASEIDTINQGNRPSKAAKFFVYAGSNPAQNKVGYNKNDLYYGAPKFSQPADAESWVVKSSIAFNSKLKSAIPNFGVNGCLDPTINNFLTVKDQS